MSENTSTNQIASAIPDQPVRNSIEQELDCSLLVEAAAGTGKTTCMVHRMIALLREGKAETKDISAITFTRKAAAQLRQKFQIGLEKAIQRENLADKAQLLNNALQNIDHIFIGTVHSFCARLLHERPVEGGIDLGFTELDDIGDLFVRDEFWKRYLEQTSNSGRSVLQSLNKIGVKLVTLRDFFDKLALYPEVELQWEERPVPDFTQAIFELDQFLQTTRKLYDTSLADDEFDKLQALCEKQIRLQQVTDFGDDAQIAEWIMGFDKNVKVTQKFWFEKESAKASKSKYDELLSTTIQPILKQWRQQCYPIIIRTLLPALKRLEQFRKDTGQLNFQDLLVLTSRMLKHNPSVRSDFQNRFRFILVDEFQDTDPLQAEILFYLCGRPVTELDWRKLQIVPGSLFIVGDPKQSIYRFRRADIGIYQQVKELLLQSGGALKILQTNFRSHKEVCSWVNGQFEEIFAPDTSVYQATNVPLVPIRDSSFFPTGVRTLTTMANRKNREESSKADANKIARIIANWIRKNSTIQPQDILLLVSEKKYITTFLNELERYQIPCEVSGSNTFSDSEELEQLIPLLQAIIEPDDQVALVAFLQGPLCGISDEALYRFRVLQKGHFNYLSSLPTAVEESIKNAFELLRVLRNDISTLPPGAALSRLIERIGLLPFTAMKPLGKLKGGALMKLLTIARDKTAHGASFAEVVQSIIELKEAVEVESITLSPNRGKAVRVMNLHKAKGLEAPIVFLADPHEPNDFEPDCVIERGTSEPIGYFRVGIRENEFQTKIIAEPFDWDRLQEKENLFERAERERLRYVAATRAADCLIISKLEVQTKTETKQYSQWVSNIDALGNCQEMDVPPEELLSANLESPIQNTITITDELEFITNRKNELFIPTYQKSSVTSIVHTDGKEQIHIDSESERGIPWGRVIHKALAAAMCGDTKLEQKFGIWLTEEDFRSEKSTVLLDTIERVKKSSLWQLALASNECYTELPFAVYDNENKETIRGIIDLVFLGDEGWVIVDYKSDVITGYSEAIIQSYSKQVQLYMEKWLILTGEKAKGYLLFTETGKIIEI